VAVTLDGEAIARGCAVGALIAVPAGVLAFLGGEGGSGTGHVPGWASLLALVAIVGLGIGAAVAARRQQLRAPLQHGIVTALVVFAVIQGFGIVRRVVAGESISWSRILSSAVLTMVAGTVGGAIGGRMAEDRAQRGLP
jgi:hypothetical protein